MNQFKLAMLQAALSPVEAAKLENHEQTIERNLRSFVDVGNALAAIRDERLYKVAFDSFEKYCEERWDLSEREANRSIEAATVVKNLEQSGQICPAPKTESQARELAKIPADQQVEVWSAVVANAAATGERITAAKVAEAVEQFTEPKRPPRDLVLFDHIRRIDHIVRDYAEKWPQPYMEALGRKLIALGEEALEKGGLPR